jgi:hypothetical protein
MANYADDRKFTNYVHVHLALPLIYKPMNWQLVDMDPNELQRLDLKSGIDYVFLNESSKKIGIQERFRELKYKHYNDFTLRYRRDFNINTSQHESEFFKVKAHYMVYGICNAGKTDNEKSLLTDFVKFAVIDLRLLFKKLDAGEILIQEGNHVSTIEHHKMLVPIKHNTDRSSSFVAFDILQLNQLFGNEHIILYQKGFF